MQKEKNGQLLFNTEEVAEKLGLGKRQVEGLFNHNPDSFVAGVHTMKIGHQGYKKKNRMYSDAGIAVIRFLGKRLIANSEAGLEAETKNQPLRDVQPKTQRDPDVQFVLIDAQTPAPNSDYADALKKLIEDAEKGRGYRVELVNIIAERRTLQEQLKSQIEENNRLANVIRSIVENINDAKISIM